MTPRYAGVVSRAIGRAVDAALLAILVASTSWLVQQLLGLDPAHCPAGEDWWHLRARLCLFLPYAVPVAGAVIPPLYSALFYLGAGQTPGMAVMGLRLLRADGGPVKLRQVVQRIGTFYLTMGLGSLLIPLSTRRRALHDIVAGTAIIYDWGSHELDVRRSIEQLRSRRA